MGYKKTSELDPALSINDSDLFAGVQESNNELDNKKYRADQLKTYFQEGTQSELTFDDVPVENSNNPVKSGGLYSEFNAKQDVLTFDAMPTDGSSNPVTSDGIHDAIAGAEGRSIPLSQKGEAGGVAELDGFGKVLSSQLPSYVDDVEEYTSVSAFPVFGEGGKIYIAIDTNLSYRWTGTGYAEISPSIALGETSSTAYRGDRGKAAYDFSQNPYNSAPNMDGTAAPGSSNSWARGDHVHPSDTSKQDVLTFDNTPTENSANPVKSGGVYSAIENATSGKQDKLTFDDAPVENSDNPVTSDGLYKLLKKAIKSFNPDPTNTVSGAIISFDDGADDIPVEDLTANIEPVQDLHGYDHPWPSGGGKNKLLITITTLKDLNTSGTWGGTVYSINGLTVTVKTDDVGNVLSITINGTATANTSFVVYQNTGANFVALVGSDQSLLLNGCPTGGAYNTFFLRLVKLSPYAIVASCYGADAAFNSDTFSGYTGSVSIVCNVDNGVTASNLVFRPMIRLATKTDPTFEPYSNICPISGWTGAEVTRMGKNLMDQTAMANITWNNGVGTIFCINSAYFNASGPHFTAKSGVSYAVSCRMKVITEATGWAPRISLRDSSNLIVASAIWSGTLGEETYLEFAYTPEADTEVYVSVIITGATASAAQAEVREIQLEIGDAATPYEPYAVTTYSVSWQTEAGTVYGGTLDVTTGVLTVDKGVATITSDEGSIGNISVSPSGTYARLSGITTASVDANAVGCLAEKSCSIPFSERVYPTTINKVRCYVDDDNLIAIRARSSDNVTTKAQLLAIFYGDKIVYPLATPVTYQLTPTEVKTLLGQNYIWTDTGDSAVKYHVDPDLWADKKMDEILND